MVDRRQPSGKPARAWLIGPASASLDGSDHSPRSVRICGMVPKRSDPRVFPVRLTGSPEQGER
jgi:hypothetical protein